MSELGTPNPDDFLDAKQRELDRGLLVKFFTKPYKDAEETLKQGRPIFKDRTYIDIRVPGERDNVCRPATQADINRFPQHYEAFMKRTGDDDEIIGTPLDQWPQVTRSQVEELAFFNVKTVEQLAAMPDSNTQQMHGLLGLKQKANAWLESTKTKEEVEKAFAEEKADLKAQIAELKEAVAALQEKKVTKKKTAKKRGRPPKVDDASTADSDGE